METNPQIWDKEKGFNFNDAIKPEFIEIPPSYDYGRSQEPLDYNRLRNKPSWWGKYFTWWRFNVNTNWSTTITWVWFEPKLIKFTAIYSNWASSAISIWHYHNWVNNCVVSYENSADFSQNARCFRLWGTNWLWNVTSVNSDWFVLNVTNTWAITYTVIYECFW